jgi:hypothetical protein
MLSEDTERTVPKNLSLHWSLFCSKENGRDGEGRKENLEDGIFHCFA